MKSLKVKIPPAVAIFYLIANLICQILSDYKTTVNMGISKLEVHNIFSVDGSKLS